MPQITCPNCGFTINLENRKKIDFHKILEETKKPKTFTELLRATHLPRKTLSLRLKELCKTGILVKENGVYKWRDYNSVVEKRTSFGNALKLQYGKRIKSVFMLAIILVCFSISGYVFARFIIPPAPHETTQQEPSILGTFTLNVMVYNVTDLYGWQVAIIYNSSELKVLKITSGGFVGNKFPCFVNSTDTLENLILIGGSLLGDVPGKNGSGKLASVLFGYYIEDYQIPKIAFEGPFATMLIDSKGNLIEIEENTLALEIS